MRMKYSTFVLLFFPRTPDWPDWLTIPAVGHSAAERMIAWGTIATAVILAVTAIFIYRQLLATLETRNAELETRNAGLLTDLSRRWDEPQIVRSQTLFMEYRVDGIVELVNKLYREGGETKEAYGDYLALIAVPNLIEALGVMEAEGMLTLRLVDRLSGPLIRGTWQAWERPIRRIRELQNDPTPYTYFESLAMRLSRGESEEPLAGGRLLAIFRPRKRGRGHA